MDRRSLDGRAGGGHHGSMDRAELADFLRRRRETLRPEDVGLAGGPRRRTPGLRREEVAGLAGMSTDYYARLEQRRSPQPSEQMTAALARALRLTLDERDHLFRLAGHSTPARFQRSDHVSPALMRVLDSVDSPALVVSDVGDTLAQNALAVALLGDQTRYEGLARSAYYRWFTDPTERTHYPEEDHPKQSRIQAAALRAALTADGSQRRAARIVAELREHSPEFVRVWARHEVTQRFEDRKTLLHPALGRIEVDCQVLFSDNRAQALLVMTTRPGTESHGKLDLLSVIGHQRFAADSGSGRPTST